MFYQNAAFSNLNFESIIYPNLVKFCVLRAIGPFLGKLGEISVKIHYFGLGKLGLKILNEDSGLGLGSQGLGLDSVLSPKDSVLDSDTQDSDSVLDSDVVDSTTSLLVFCVLDTPHSLTN